MLIYRRVERVAGPDDSVLDLGAKDGRHLGNIPGAVFAADLVFEFPLGSEGPQYIYADGRQLPFEDDSFDYVVLNQILEHIDNRETIIYEVSRVLKPDGEALFSFPNRYSANRPHELPRWLSVVPKPIGKRITSQRLDSARHRYYVDNVFPLSSVRGRRLLSEHFGSVSYITVDESMRNSEVFGDSVGGKLFTTALPCICDAMRLYPFARLFELFWPYCGYSCAEPKR